MESSEQSNDARHANQITYIAKEIVEEIMKTLPIKSTFRFKCLSKDLTPLIESCIDDQLQEITNRYLARFQNISEEINKIEKGYSDKDDAWDIVTEVVLKLYSMESVITSFESDVDVSQCIKHVSSLDDTVDNMQRSLSRLRSVVSGFFMTLKFH